MDIDYAIDTDYTIDILLDTAAALPKTLEEWRLAGKSSFICDHLSSSCSGSSALGWLYFLGMGDGLNEFGKTPQSDKFTWTAGAVRRTYPHYGRMQDELRTLFQEGHRV